MCVCVCVCVCGSNEKIKMIYLGRSVTKNNGSSCFTIIKLLFRYDTDCLTKVEAPSQPNFITHRCR